MGKENNRGKFGGESSQTRKKKQLQQHEPCDIYCCIISPLGFKCLVKKAKKKQTRLIFHFASTIHPPEAEC